MFKEIPNDERKVFVYIKDHIDERGNEVVVKPEAVYSKPPVNPEKLTTAQLLAIVYPILYSVDGSNVNGF